MRDILTKILAPIQINYKLKIKPFIILKSSMFKLHPLKRYQLPLRERVSFIIAKRHQISLKNNKTQIWVTPISKRIHSIISPFHLISIKISLPLKVFLLEKLVRISIRFNHKELQLYNSKKSIPNKKMKMLKERYKAKK